LNGHGFGLSGVTPNFRQEEDRSPCSLRLKDLPSLRPSHLDERTNMSHIQPVSDHYGPAIQPFYPKPLHPPLEAPAQKGGHDTVSISADAHRQYQTAGHPTHAHHVAAAQPLRGAAEIHHRPELHPQEPQKPTHSLQKPRHSLRRALKAAGLGARHIGGLTGGYIGRFVGKQIGGLVADLTGSKALGKAAGTIAGTTSGAFAGGLFGAACPSFCPHGGALFAGISGAFEAFKANQGH